MTRLGLALAALVACANGEPKSQWPWAEGLRPPAPPPQPCAITATASHDTDLYVHLMVGPGIDPEALEPALQPMALFAQGLGLTLQARGPAEPIDAVAMVTDGPDPLAPLDALVRSRAGLNPGGVDLVVVPTLVPQGIGPIRERPDQTALTVSPRLQDHVDLQPGALDHNALQGLSPDATPTIVVSWTALSEVRPGAADWILAHELGHAMGLRDHYATPQLMGPTRWSACAPTLSPREAITIGASVAALRAACTNADCSLSGEP